MSVTQEFATRDEGQRGLVRDRRQPSSARSPLTRSDMAGIALTQSNLLSTQIGQDDAWSANAPASAPAADISWSHYEDIGHATGAAIRKRIVGAAQSTAKTAFKPIQQAVDIPIQVGKQGTENALARALPGIMRRATPLLRKKVEQRLRRLADGEEDINAWRPSRLREKIFLRLELSDEQQQQQQQAARGGGGGGGAAAAAAPLIEELDVALLEVAPNTSSKDSSGQNASSSSGGGGSSSSSSGLNSRSVCLAAKTLVNISLRPHCLKLIADLLPSPSQPQQPATAAAGSGSAASSRQPPPQTAQPPQTAAPAAGQIKRDAISITPLTCRMLARMLVWWDTASGELRFAFSEAPDFNLQSQIDIGPAFLCRCFSLALPRCVTDDLLSKILCPIIGSYNE